MNRQLRLLVYCSIVLVSAYYYFVERPFEEEKILERSVYLFLALALVPAAFTFVMGLFAKKLLPNDRMSLFGTSRKWSLLIYLLPVLCLTIIGVPNEYGFQNNYCGLVLGLLMVIYTLFEEMGWRGYMNQELESSGEWPRAIAIGLIWYVWHWDFMNHETIDVLNIALFVAAFVFASLGIGKIADHTSSVLVAAAFHALGNIGFFFGLIRNNVAIEYRMGIIVVCVLAWYLIIKQWDKDKDEKLQKSNLNPTG